MLKPTNRLAPAAGHIPFPAGWDQVVEAQVVAAQALQSGPVEWWRPVAALLLLVEAGVVGRWGGNGTCGVAIVYPAPGG